MDQAPIKIGQYVLGKNLGIGAFGKVSSEFDRRHGKDRERGTLVKVPAG
jgi:hypothetical protein